MNMVISMKMIIQNVRINKDNNSSSINNNIQERLYQDRINNMKGNRSSNRSNRKQKILVIIEIITIR